VCVVYVAEKYPCSSCKEILELNLDSSSGEYSIKTIHGKALENVSIGKLFSCHSRCSILLETIKTALYRGSRSDGPRYRYC